MMSLLNARYTGISFFLTIATLLIAIPARGLIVCPGPSTLQGVDVSEFQGTIDWNAVAASGIQFAYTRVSNGTVHLDPTFDQKYAGIRAAGLARGAYQFFEPSQDPSAQATILLQKIGTLRQGDLPPALDVEDTGGQSPATISAAIQTWVTIVQNATGRPPIILTGTVFWNSNVGSSNFSGNPLWIAAFGVTCPNLPIGWQNWTFQLYADNGSVPGISGLVDLDKFNGTLADLNNLSIVPFASFSSTVGIGNNSFELQGNFQLGNANHAIDPPDENVTIQVASFSVIIPTGSFRKTKNGQFFFEGVINGVSLDVKFLPKGQSGFMYIVEAEEVNLSGTANPVTVILTIGNQRGTITTNAKFD